MATLTTDAEGKAVLNNLPLGSYYLKETTAGEHFVLNTEMKEFTLTAEDIASKQGDVLIEKDTLLEKKATDENGNLTFDSDLFHGKYYVKEEVRKPGYLPNEEIWEIDASYEDQNVETIILTKEIENQPTESHFTKTDATTGDDPWKPLLLAICGLSAAVLAVTTVRKRKQKDKGEKDKTNEKTAN